MDSSKEARGPPGQSWKVSTETWVGGDSPDHMDSSRDLRTRTSMEKVVSDLSREGRTLSDWESEVVTVVKEDNTTLV